MEYINLASLYRMKNILHKPFKQPLKSPMYNSLNMFGWELGLSVKY